MTDSKKRDANKAAPPSLAEQEALARDASELRALIARARRLIDRNAIDQSETLQQQSADADRLEDEGSDEPMEVPIFAKPVPVRSEGGESESEPEGDQSHDIAALPEAFFTNTMGTLLLAQNRAFDASVVFERVLLRDPKNEEARRGLERAITAQENAPSKQGHPASHTLLRNRQSPVLRPARVAGGGTALSTKPTSAPTEPKEPDGLLDRTDAPWGYDIDELRVLPVDPNTLVVFWELREQTLTHARTSAGFGGNLALRIISIRRTEDGGIQRDERIERGAGRVGDWFVHGVDAGATHQVSIGLEGRAGFLAILSAQPMSTARGAPAKQRAVVRARISLPTRTRVASRELPRITEVVGPESVVNALVEERNTPALREATVISLPIRKSAESAASPQRSAPPTTWTERSGFVAYVADGYSSEAILFASDASNASDASGALTEDEEEFFGTPRLNGHPSSARPTSGR